MDTTNNSEASGAAQNITMSKKVLVAGYWCIESNLMILFLFLRDDKQIKTFYADSIHARV